MANGMLGEILGQVLSGAGARQHEGQPGGNAGGGLGDLLGSIVGGAAGAGGLGGLAGLGRRSAGMPAEPSGGLSAQGGSYASKTALLAMLLPLALQWVQRKGGIGAVLQSFRDKGYDEHAASWVSTGPNQQLAPQAVDEVVGHEELSRLSQQLGVGEQDVRGGLAEILPEMVDKLSPHGEVVPDAQERIDGGVSSLEQMLGGLFRR